MALFSKHAFGLDVSDRSIEALEVKKKFGKLAVAAYSRVSLASGIVESGRVLDRQRLAVALQELLRTATPAPFSTREVVLSLPESKTFIHVFRLPAVISADTVAESVQYEAEATIPLLFNQLYHDYQVVERTADYQDILYVASFKDTVDEFRSVLAEVGLRPVVFEPESAALARALIRGRADQPILLVDIGSRTTIITVFSHQSIRYSENVRIGGSHLTERITGAMGVDRDEAERIKRHIGLVREKTKEKIFANLEPPVREITKGIRDSMRYCSKQWGQTIGRLILCGGGSLIPGIREYLASQLGLAVEIGNPLTGFQYSARMFQDSNPVLFSTVVGLAWRGLNDSTIKSDINQLSFEHEHARFQKSHLPTEQRPRRAAAEQQAPAATARKIPRKRLLILTAIFVLLILAFIAVLLLQQGKDEPLIQFQQYDYPSQPVRY